MRKLLSLVLLSAFVLPSVADARRQRIQNVFQYHKSEDLSAADATITIQQPASGSIQLNFLWATVGCEVATVVTLRVGGTAASTTDDSSSIVDITQRSLTATAEAYHTSNAGAGTTTEIHDCPAGGLLSLDLSKYAFDEGVATTNLTIDTDDVTGFVRVTITWQEED